MRFLYVIYIILLGWGSSAAQSWLSPWQARHFITITNFNLSDLHDYQVRVEIPFNECMNTDFEDVRFTDSTGTQVLSHFLYYMEPGELAVYYVKVPFLQAYAESTIFCYYGNNQAQDSSDPYATFIFYDDMDDDEGWIDIDENVVKFQMFQGKSVLRKKEECGLEGAWKSIGDPIPDFKLLTKDWRKKGGNFNRMEITNGCHLNEYGVYDDDFVGFDLRRDGSNQFGSGEFGLSKRVGNMYDFISVTQANQPGHNWYYTEVSYCHVCLFNLNAQIWNEDMELLQTEFGSDYYMYDFDRVVVRGGHNYYIDFMAVAQKACIEPIVSHDILEECPKATLISSVVDDCGAEITFAVMGGVAPYTITYERDGTPIGQITAPQADTLTLQGLVDGVYTIRVAGDNGCEN